MQTETIIIAIGLLIGWIATALYLIKASQKAYARGLSKALNGLNEQHAQEVEGLRQDLYQQIALRKTERDGREPACSLADHEMLTNIAMTLRLAKETWQGFPGTEAMVTKVSQQHRLLSAFAAKMWVSAYPEQPDGEEAA